MIAQVIGDDADDGLADFVVVLAQPVGELFLNTGYGSSLARVIW